MKNAAPKVVVAFSGGCGSYVSAKRAVERYGCDDVLLLFCDTRVEDKDCYRFIDDAVEYFGCASIVLREGRTIWEVFRDKKFLGNNRVPLCSRILKGEMADKWWDDNTSSDTISVVGIDFSESHRAKRLQKRLPDRKFWFPLLDRPLLNKRGQIAEIIQDGLVPPRLYSIGAPHNNCGGGCVRAGIAHFRWLLNAMPCVYEEWERNEEELRQFLGKDVSILKERRKDRALPLTLRVLRERLASVPSLFADEEWGGCGCFVEE